MIKKKKIEADLTNLKSETTTNQEQGKKNTSRYDPWQKPIEEKRARERKSEELLEKKKQKLIEEKKKKKKEQKDLRELEKQRVRSFWNQVKVKEKKKKKERMY